ncbi:hypothetical protein L198_07389 [Cryptococcus wingfieldii CBS 7118]|uniref:Uncharacterized protein n=1 Tax=Cryptococcus wingfieldii CBS 7118 TaxID=1295528 RepID=A0A1E3IDS8_9TREE|nr:hypothetical protein L198_07389 [Cryptococcus wingfieldii CBS 7118]ODN86096.1 hypothetical protein L198_07389 [Cryptococcus wingfieldii CBS 7118]
MLINQDSRLLGSYFGEVPSGLWSDPQDHEFDINEQREGRAPDLEFWKEIDKGWWFDGEFVVTTAHQQQHKLSAHNRSARHIKEGRDETSGAEVASKFYAQGYGRQPDSVRAASSSSSSSSSVSSLRTVVGDSSFTSTKTLDYHKATDEGASAPTPAFVPQIISVHGWSLLHANPVEVNRHWAVDTYLRDHIRPYIPEAQLVWLDYPRAESAG